MPRGSSRSIHPDILSIHQVLLRGRPIIVEKIVKLCAFRLSNLVKLHLTHLIIKIRIRQKWLGINLFKGKLVISGERQDPNQSKHNTSKPPQLLRAKDMASLRNCWDGPFQSAKGSTEKVQRWSGTQELQQLGTFLGSCPTVRGGWV